MARPYHLGPRRCQTGPERPVTAEHVMPLPDLRDRRGATGLVFGRGPAWQRAFAHPMHRRGIYRKGI